MLAGKRDAVIQYISFQCLVIWEMHLFIFAVVLQFCFSNNDLTGGIVFP